MTAEVILQEHVVIQQEALDNKCSSCGFDMPEGILVCWRCGERLTKY